MMRALPRTERVSCNRRAATARSATVNVPVVATSFTAIGDIALFIGGARRPQ